MPASMFDDTLHADPGRPAEGFRLGPCAMGPVREGDTVTHMHVWLLQNGRNVAAATGTSGKHAKQPAERPPYRGRWMIRTELDPGSDAFDEDEATALALAVVTHPDGSRDVEQWTQQVRIHTSGHH